MGKVTNDDALWFEDEIQAENLGYTKCSECFNKKIKSKGKPQKLRKGKS